MVDVVFIHCIYGSAKVAIFTFFSKKSFIFGDINAQKGKVNRFKAYIQRLTNISDHTDIPDAVSNIKGNINFRGPNVWILVFSIIIASVGLNVNSIPVIIGAMLISPLMGPIFGLGLGLGTNDTALIRDSLKNLVIMIVISVIASCLYFLISPLDLDKPTELLARTNPTIYDVLIALFGGFAGIFEISRKEKGTVMSGVAIATALMPPLCTAGYGIASGKVLYFIGASYLFFINCAFIILATYFSVRYMKFPSVKFADPRSMKRTKRLISAVVVILIVPSVLSAVSVIRQNNFDIAADDFLKETVSIGDNYIYNHNIEHHKGSKLEIFMAGPPLTTEKKESLYERAAGFGIGRDQLVITESTGSAGGNDMNEEFLKSLYDITNDEIQKRENLIAELEAELRKVEDSEIPYGQIAREIATQIPGITSLAILKGASVDMGDDYTTEDRTYVLISCGNGSAPNMERLREWLSVRLNEENLYVMEVDRNVIDGIKEKDSK